MASKPGPGRCVHCLAYFDNRNWDHVFPKSWYPDTTPPNLAKWQIPTCYACNEAYGKLEQDLLVRIALCLDSLIPETAGIVARGLRSIDPNTAHSQNDINARHAKLVQLRGDMLLGGLTPTEGIYPNFENQWGGKAEDQGAIRVSADSIRKLTEKIVRGIHYLESKEYIEKPYAVTFFAITDEDAMEITKTLKAHGERYAREPGIEVLRILAPEDGNIAFYSITIFGKLNMYASVDCAVD